MALRMYKVIKITVKHNLNFYPDNRVSLLNVFLLWQHVSNVQAVIIRSIKKAYYKSTMTQVLNGIPLRSQLYYIKMLLKLQVIVKNLNTLTMFVGITRSILLVSGIVSIDAGRYTSVPVVFLLESMLFFKSGVYGFIYTLNY
jgi:hypothetical protein